MITKRAFLKQTTLTLASASVFPAWASLAADATAPGRLRIGSCRVSLEQAKLAGLDGVEIGVGNAADKLSLADPAVRRDYREQMTRTGLVISSLMMGVLNSNPLASDPRAPAWLEQCIDAAKDLGAGVILVAFFGKGDLLQDGQLKREDVKSVVARLRRAAPRAADAGVVLAIENTLSARQNLDILDQIGSQGVRVYYDVGNSSSRGYDVPAEIRLLKEQIACIHFKDRNHYLGEGTIQFEPIAAAIKAIGYSGWIVMETANPSKDAVTDARRNAAFIRRLFGMS
jgi:sugar phosphate isomerase/epimerase